MTTHPSAVPASAEAQYRGDESPTIEVRVFRHGELVSRHLCESEEQAQLVVDEWAELDGVRCEVDDLSVQHRPDDILAPDPDLLDTDPGQDYAAFPTSSGRAD